MGGTLHESIYRKMKCLRALIDAYGTRGPSMAPYTVCGVILSILICDRATILTMCMQEPSAMALLLRVLCAAENVITSLYNGDIGALEVAMEFFRIDSIMWLLSSRVTDVTVNLVDRAYGSCIRNDYIADGDRKSPHLVVN